MTKKAFDGSVPGAGKEGYKVIITGVCQQVPELIASAQGSAMVLDIRIYKLRKMASAGKNLEETKKVNN